MHKGLKGKTYIITGAARGIGYAAAERLVAEGANVMLADVDKSGLEVAVDVLGQDRADYMVTDVTQISHNQALVLKTKDRFGSLHGGILNAGIAGDLKPFTEIELETFDQVMAVNVRGVWLGLQALIPELDKAGGGSIVLTGSVSGVRAGAPNRSPYVVSKHALIGLMRAAAAECASLGIRVNAVSPGGVNTDMVSSFANTFGDEKAREMMAAYAASVPLGRLAEPGEVADVMVFLLGEESRYCTGTNYMVDGGLTG